MEQWRSVIGYEGLYEVSETGMIRSVSRKRNITPACKRGCFYRSQIISQYKTKDGYLRVGLSKNGVYSQKLVHRLVAEAYIPNVSNLPEVNHKDENKQNNAVENLEWCDKKYNINYATANLRRAKSISKAKAKGCYAIKADGTIQSFESMREAAAITGISQGGISSVCSGKRKTAGGLIWRKAP